MGEKRTWEESSLKVAGSGDEKGEIVRGQSKKRGKGGEEVISRPKAQV